MNLLLDTHILLWWLADDPALRSSVRRAIADPDNVVFVSPASVWEIVIKHGLGKLELSSDFEQVLEDEAFQHLAITSRHCFKVGELPEHHRDPFDRLLIAQTLVEDLVLVTDDHAILQYDVPTLISST